MQQLKKTDMISHQKVAQCYVTLPLGFDLQTKVSVKNSRRESNINPFKPGDNAAFA